MTPSLAVARAAKDLKPFYSVCETTKFNALPPEKAGLEEGLERVPPDMITGIVTERGVLKTGEVIGCVRKMERYAETLLEE